MKRLLALILITAITLSISACGLLLPQEITSSEEAQSSIASEVSEDSEATDVDASEETAVCTPLLYKVTSGKGGVLYLLGSIHIGDERLDEMPDYILNAYTESDFLAVEFDIFAYEQDLSAQIECSKLMMCEQGKNIESHIGKELFEKAKKFLTQHGAYNNAYKSYRPSMWMSLIDNAIYEESKLDTETGVDKMFLELARADGKDIREIESAIEQYKVLNSFSDELYKYMIDTAIDHADESVKAIEDSYEVWLKGDEAELTAALADDLTGEPEKVQKLYEEYSTKLLTERNNTMKLAAEQYLAEGGVGFYVVGAAHIVGENGLAKTLSEDYTVTIVK